MRSPLHSELVGLVGLVTVAILAFPASAAAQSGGTKRDPKATYVESKDDSGQVVKFTDDPLDGTGLGTTPQIIDGGHRASKQNLMRPRYNFVTELRKSVENM